MLPLVAALLLCLSAAYAQTGSAASVVSLTGQVSVLRDNYPKALNIGDSIEPKQIVVTGPNGWAEFRVADGSTIQAFPNSTFVFRKSYNLQDLLDLTIGWVKIHIQKLGNQPNPNNVHTPTAVISVRGTTFDVRVEDDAETTFVSVDEGMVDVRNLTVGGPAKTLTNGESLHVYKGQQLAKVVDKAPLPRASCAPPRRRSTNSSSAPPARAARWGARGVGLRPTPASRRRLPRHRRPLLRRHRLRHRPLLLLLDRSFRSPGWWARRFRLAIGYGDTVT